MYNTNNIKFNYIIVFVINLEIDIIIDQRPI